MSEQQNNRQRITSKTERRSLSPEASDRSPEGYRSASAIPTGQPRDHSRYSRNSAQYHASNASRKKGGSGKDRRSSSNDVHEAHGEFSGRASDARYRAKAKRKRKRFRRLKLALALTVAILLCGGGAAFAYVSGITSALRGGVDLSAVLAKSDINNEPFYMAIFGTDASEEREGDAYFGGVFRTDTIMVARIDPVGKQVTLISIPRDTKVELKGYGVQKINAAHALGGAELAVKAVSDLTGFPISHYAEVNFEGFCGIVDAVGGIEVDVPTTIDDDEAGGYLAAGPQTLTGEQALILCRSRHTYDATGPGDLYRAANQRMVVGAIAKKVLDTNILVLPGVIGEMSRSVTTDLSVTDFIALARNFQGFDAQNDLYSAAFPTTSKQIGGIWYEIPDTAAWATMKSRIEQGLPPLESDQVDESGTVLANSGGGSVDSTKHAGKVCVRNGTTTKGLGSVAGEVISAMGFTPDVGNASSSFTTTVVVYDKDSYQREAEAIVEALGCGSAVKNDGSYINNGKFLVVLGQDYADAQKKK